MKFVKLSKLWLTNFGKPDISLGVHICMKGRVDFHVLYWMISIGVVPIYEDNNGKQFAVSNSFHSNKKLPIRAGVP